MSEVRTNATKQDKEDGTFIKYIGSNVYVFEFEDDDFDIIKKGDIE